MQYMVLKKCTLVLALLLSASSLFAEEVREELVNQLDERPQGVRFNVDDVKIADDLLMGCDAEYIFSRKLKRSIFYMPEEHREEILLGSKVNNLLVVVKDAYALHRPLVLSPDAIWLTICQGMSIHINLNFKKLEPVIYKNGHPSKIEIVDDNANTLDPQWQDVIDSISSISSRYTGRQFHDAFVPQFSTTTASDRVAYQITLLHAQQKAYSYIVHTACGIPYITLTGTTEDWLSIKERLSVLDKLGMEKWKRSLEPIIDQFVNASRGNVDVEFWRNIYKNKKFYDLYAITGWIHRLFPYITAHKPPMYDDGEEILVPNPFLDKKVTSSDSLTSDKFPKGLSMVPLIWHNHVKNETKKLRLYGGFMGVKQYSDKSLEPFISWAICDEEEVLGADDGFMGGHGVLEQCVPVDVSEVGAIKSRHNGFFLCAPVTDD